MALFLKQDFSPPVLSRKWIAMKFRPNILLYSRENIVSILESGLLFREDSIEVEQETSSIEVGVWLSKGERVLSVLGGGLCLYLAPPRSLNRSLVFHVAAYASIPLCVRALHRRVCRGCARALLQLMRDYLTLARRAAACVKESAALRTQLGSVSSVVEATHTMLCRQQLELGVLMSRASSAVLGNAPWLRGDIAWEATNIDGDNLMKIHHAFLVIQSTLLKHIALAHSMPTVHTQKIYKNHNERIYWIHSVLMKRLIEEFKDNYEALERMYRLLKNYGNTDVNRPMTLGSAVKDNWLYSDVHTGIARATLELKLANDKCNNLDIFLDSCALNKQEIDLTVLNSDIDDLIEIITKCLTTVQSSQIRLTKLTNKFAGGDDKALDRQSDVDSLAGDVNILQIEDKDPETKDEVFYFVKTEDDEIDNQTAIDLTTGPGKKERENTKIVLNELKRKLVIREDVMRERERQALRKTMPELKNNVPEFPRQMSDDFLDRKSIFTKLSTNRSKNTLTEKLSGNLKRNKDRKRMKFKLEYDKYTNETEINCPFYEANSKINAKSKYLSFDLKPRNKIFITRWFQQSQIDKAASSTSEGFYIAHVETNATNKTVNQAINGHVNGDSCLYFEARNFKFSKKDLELSPSSSDSELDDFYHEKQIELLKDARRLRAARKKNHISRRLVIDKADVDEGSKPIDYNFGAGMAMASVLQISSQRKMPNFVEEEVFTGDGEVSNDSGNDEDA